MVFPDPRTFVAVPHSQRPDDPQQIGKILRGSEDPPIDGVKAPIGSLFLNADTGTLYCKTGPGNTDWTAKAGGGGNAYQGLEVTTGATTAGDAFTWLIAEGETVTDNGGTESVVVPPAGITGTLAGIVVGPGGVDSVYATPALPGFVALHLIDGDGVAVSSVISNVPAIAEDAVPDLSAPAFAGYTRSRIIGLLRIFDTGGGVEGFDEQFVANSATAVRRTNYTLAIPVATVPSGTIGPVALATQVPTSDQPREIGATLRPSVGADPGEFGSFFNGDDAPLSSIKISSFFIGAVPVTNYGELLTSADGVTVQASLISAGGTNDVDIAVTYFDTNML